MTAGLDSSSSGRGRITHGPQINALVERTLEFVLTELPKWRDRKDRKIETAEERLNAQLCKHLNSMARQKPLPVLFHHEERQAENRRVDISAGLAEGGFIGSVYLSIDDPFVVFEGKRLPSPGGKSREREYVTGRDLRSGGIQRFKLGLHGARLSKVALIGYIQKQKAAFWFGRINDWIREEAGSLALDELKWTLDEQLREFSYDRRLAISRCISRHLRSSPMASNIQIEHLWVEIATA